jgi:hypothetical protein
LRLHKIKEKQLKRSLYIEVQLDIADLIEEGEVDAIANSAVVFVNGKQLIMEPAANAKDALDLLISELVFGEITDWDLHFLGTCIVHADRKATAELHVPCAPGGILGVCEECKKPENIEHVYNAFTKKSC